MQQGIANRCGRLGHENPRLRLLPHEDGKRSDMVEMRMRKENRVQRTITQVTQKRAAPFPFLLGMHPAIQHHSLAAGAEVVTAGADFGPASKINELQDVRAPCQPPAREQSAITGSNEESARELFSGNGKCRPATELVRGTIKSSGYHLYSLGQIPEAELGGGLRTQSATSDRHYLIRSDVL